jgi:ATP/ADP translocase
MRSNASKLDEDQEKAKRQEERKRFVARAYIITTTLVIGVASLVIGYFLSYYIVKFTNFDSKYVVPIVYLITVGTAIVILLNRLVNIIHMNSNATIIDDKHDRNKRTP